ncbi:MAG: transcription termination/antitermination NusG family protein [Pseudomonadota bacterium]
MTPAKQRASWFAFRVEPQKERLAAQMVRNGGVFATVPLAQKWRRKNRFQKKRQAVKYPVMSGYILARLEGETLFDMPWRTVFSPHLVKSVVGANDRPLELSAQQVDNFLLKERNGVFSDATIFKNMRTHGEFELGDLVEFTAQGFEGCKGRVVGLTEREARILAPFLGGEREIRAPVDACCKAA